MQNASFGVTKNLIIIFSSQYNTLVTESYLNTNMAITIETAEVNPLLIGNCNALFNVLQLLDSLTNISNIN